jgi:hypothetical protein
VRASSAVIDPAVAARQREGDEHALTVRTMLAILYACTAHAEWPMAGGHHCR